MFRKIFIKVADWLLGFNDQMLCNHCGKHVVSRKQYLCHGCWDLCASAPDPTEEDDFFSRSDATWEDVFGY